MGHPLRQYRDETGKTLEEAAEALGVSAANLSRIENGKHLPSADLMRRIAEWSGGAITPNDLVGIARQPCAEPAPEAAA